MKVTIFGTGYVGLIAGACFARAGHQVLCYDNDAHKIEELQKGKKVIHEPGLDDLLSDAATKQKLVFTANIHQALTFSDLYVLCIGTPQSPDGSADLRHLHAVVDEIGKQVDQPFFVIVKSTVPTGTVEALRDRLQRQLDVRHLSYPFELAFIPEFLVQGNAIHSFTHADRLIIGSEGEAGFQRASSLYAPITAPHDTPVLRMSIPSAELTKYAANAFLAMKISFVNELSRIAEITGADIETTLQGMTLDKRIGPGASHPGCGFGGSCFPKDLEALIHLAESHDYQSFLLQAALNVNTAQRNHFINKILHYFNHRLDNKIIALWGLSFKPETDDIREAVSCYIIQALLEAGASIQAYDPVATKNMQAKYPNQNNLRFVNSKEDALQNADALVVVTEWEEFFDLNYSLLKTTMKNPVIFDGRNIYSPAKLEQEGIEYFGIGYGIPIPQKTAV